MHKPTFTAYELRLLRHTNPPLFMPYEPFLLGVVLNFVDTFPSLRGQIILYTPHGPPTPENTLLGVGGVKKGGGV